MRKVIARQVAGYIAGLLGLMVASGLAAMLLFGVEQPSTGVAIAAVACVALILASLCLLLGSALLEGGHRDSSHQDIAEIKAKLADVTTALESLQADVEEYCGDVNSLTLLAGATAKRLDVTERQMAAAQDAAGALARAQVVLDRLSDEQRRQPNNVYRIR